MRHISINLNLSLFTYIYIECHGIESEKCGRPRSRSRPSSTYTYTHTHCYTPRRRRPNWDCRKANAVQRANPLRALNPLWHQSQSQSLRMAWLPQLRTEKTSHASRTNWLLTKTTTTTIHRRKPCYYYHSSWFMAHLCLKQNWSRAGKIDAERCMDNLVIISFSQKWAAVQMGREMNTKVHRLGGFYYIHVHTVVVSHLKSYLMPIFGMGMTQKSGGTRWGRLLNLANFGAKSVERASEQGSSLRCNTP